MNVSTAIETRRAVKHFDPNHRMPAADEQRLSSLAILSRTAFNIQNWRPVVVRDPALRQKNRAAAWDQVQVTDASLFCVLCADLRSWERKPERYWVNAPEAVQKFLLPAIDSYYRGKDQVMRDEAMRSCGMIAQTRMLAAKEMGYDSCPMDGFDFAAVGKLINLPADHVVAMFVAIGKGIKPAWPTGGQLPLSEIIINNRF
jgi:nitroreductase